MKKTITIVLSLILAASSALAAPKQQVLNSPDGRITISVSVDGGVKYCVSKDGVQLLAPSGISMTLPTAPSMADPKQNFRRSLSRASTT